jgi:hypothetical protein
MASLGLTMGNRYRFLGGLNLSRARRERISRTRTRSSLAAQLQTEKPIFNERILTNHLELQPGHDSMRRTGVRSQMSCSFLVR